MKKNRTMKVAALLLALTLMTSCFVGGTFAKYTTTGGAANETARVAKWGVEITAEGGLFSKTYMDVNNGNIAGIANLSVSSSDSMSVVAPGTKNEEGLTFTLTGTPEVKVDVDIEVTATDIVVPKDAVTALTEDYYPVVFTLKNGAGEELVKGKLSEVETFLEGLSDSYEAETNLAKIGNNTDGIYVLTWEWAFENNDAADTYLGNQETAQTVVFGISITVEQLD